jgi:hypothetical protein
MSFVLDFMLLFINFCVLVLNGWRLPMKHSKKYGFNRTRFYRWFTERTQLTGSLGSFFVLVNRLFNQLRSHSVRSNNLWHFF